jgi:Glycosyl-4,4'-diaponeurosporenoate acyltransferase
VVAVVAAAAATAVAGALLVWAWRSLGPGSVGVALLNVWIPMTWLGTISHVVTIRLPEPFHRLRPWERDGRVYERLGVRTVKRLLRSGPLALFNPHLHIPHDRTAQQLARLDGRMCEAEASHAILLVATIAVVVHAGARGWWTAAAATFVFDVVINGYPVMLQRYNRALLRLRFPGAFTGG